MDRLSQSNKLRLVRDEPLSNEAYTIESIKPSISGNDGLLISLRIVNTDHRFTLPVRELIQPKWLNVLSKWDAMKAGLYYSIETSKAYDQLEKLETINLFQHKYILIFAFLYITLIILSNIIGGKLTVLFGFDFPAVLYVFPMTLILGDILTEVYGYPVTKRIIWLGFFGNMIALLAIFLVGKAPSSEFWTLQKEYEQIFNVSFRISFASLLAYIGGEFLNAYILSSFKKKTNGKYMWFRIMGASTVSDFFDSIIFCAFAFLGSVPNVLLVRMILIQIVFKICYELIASPFTCKLCRFVKRKESIDTYDYGVNYNPLSF